MKKILLILSIAISVFNAKANSENKNIKDIEKINCISDAIPVTSSDVLICENKGGVITLDAKFSFQDSLTFIASGAVLTWEVGGNPIVGLINLDAKFMKVTVPSPTTTTTYTVRIDPAQSNGCPNPTGSVLVTVKLVPTDANAGLSQIGSATCGLSSVNLSAVPVELGHGTGVWSFDGDAIGGSFGDANVYNTTFTGTKDKLYTIRWTVTNAPCTASTDTAQVLLNQKPDDAFAGADKIDATTCGLTSVTLDANIPVNGNGKWTIISGIGGSFVDDSNAKSVFNGVAGSTYVLRWTISKLPCDDAIDEVTITFNKNPDVATANVDQIDINTCGLTSVNLAANTPTVGTGLWTIVSGTGGSFADDKNPTTGFSGIAGNDYTVKWTISNAPCSDSNDETNIKFNQNPTKAIAGADQIDASTCGLSAVTLAANTPTIGTGLWTIVSGTGGSFADDKNPTSTFTGTPGVSYVLSWTISNLPCASSSDSVNVKLNQIPDKSFAGIDQTGISTCGKTGVQISGNAPTVGVGVWTIISGNGGVIVDKDAATTDLNGIEDSTYTVSWTITNAPCSSSSDTATIKFNVNPTKANAGPDQIDQVTCGKTTVSLNANIPTRGTGTWSYLSGDTTGISKNLFSSDSDPKSTFTGKAGKAYSLVWNIIISPCGISMDTVDILFNENPIASASNQNLCIIGANASTSLGGNATNGTGVWSIVSGTGTLSGNTYSNTNETTSTLKWKVTGYCGVDSNVVDIRFRIKPNAPLIGGPDSILLCNGGTVNLLATTPDTDVTFKWFNGSSEVIPSNNTLALTVNEVGFYSITAYNINGCENSSNTIKVISRTSQSQNLNDTICQGVNYTVKPFTLKGNKYSWKYIDSINVIGTDSFLVVNLNKRHVFVLSIIDSICGSLKPDTFFIDVFPQSEVRLTALDSICLGTAVELTATVTKQSAPKYKYTWYADSVYINGIFNDTLNTKWVMPTKLSTKYEVVVEDTNGCFSSDEYLIKAVEWNLNEPNIFTPNTDGVNDAFYINIAPNSTVAIEFYNRWGAQMYKSDNYSNDTPWTGDGASDGIYYYTMKPTCPNKTIKKWVQIAR